MGIQLNGRVLALAAALGIAGVQSGHAAKAPLRDWTLEDSVRLRYFLGEQLFLGNNYKDAIQYSPDRRYVSVVTQRGDIEKDMNVVEICVYSMDSLRAALNEKNAKRPAPAASTSFLTFLNQVSVEWQPDSRGIRFDRGDKDVSLGWWSVREATAEMHVMEVPSGKVRRLSTRTGRPAVFEDEGAVVGWLRGSSDAPEEQTYYPLVRLDHHADGSISSASFFATIRGETGLYFRGRETLVIPQSLENAWIAPGGRKAIALLSDFRMTPLTRAEPTPKFFLLDLEQGRFAPLGGEEGVAMGAADPGHPKPDVLWNDDGTRALLVNATVAAARSPAIANGLVEYEVTSGRLQAMPMNENYRWLGRSIVPPAASAVEPANDKAVQVSILQSANRQPSLVATDGANRMVLSDPDAALSGLWLTQVEPFQWQDPDGSIQKGALLLPRSLKKGSPVPLVIQVQHAVDLGLFLPDGTSSNGYAAQTYAANGMAVLMVAMPKASQLPMMPAGKREGAITVARLDAAVAALASRIQIDRARIGLIGHSRCGFMIHYAITHPARERFAAAAIMDSYTGGYPMHLEGTTPDSAPAREEYGGDFWSHKASWFEHETSFNADRVRTPALFTVNTATPNQTSTTLNASIGAFNANRKPIEALWFPTATHNPMRPRERLAIMGAALDWMLFWLKDQSPADPERVASWAPLRKMQEEVLKTPPVPRGTWKFIPDTGPAGE